jgi:hypothetical protein
MWTQTSLRLGSRVLVTGVVLYLVLSHLADLRANVSKRDSICYWAAAHLLVNHHNPYDSPSVMALEQQQGYTDGKPLVLRTPPWSLFMVMPLAMMNAFWAWMSWVTASIAALVFGIRLCWKMFGNDLGPPAFFLLAGYTFAPVPACLVSGQMGILLLLGLVLFLWLESSRPFLAGAGLIFPFAKPHLLALFWLLLLVWVIVEKKWKVAAGFATSFAVAIVLALISDPAVFQHYRQMLREAAIGSEFIPALSGVLRLLFFRTAFWTQFVPVAVAVPWAIRMYVVNRSSWDWRVHGLTLMVVSILTSPYAWISDEVILLPAILQATIWVYSARRQLTTRARLLIFALVFLNILLLLILRAKVPFATGIYFWSSLVWFGWYFLGRSLAKAAERIQTRPYSLNSTKLPDAENA